MVAVMKVAMQEGEGREGERATAVQILTVMAILDDIRSSIVSVVVTSAAGFRIQAKKEQQQCL